MQETVESPEQIFVPEHLRTFETNFRVLPADTNYHKPMVFGGKMAQEIDLCCAGLASRIATYCGRENYIDTVVTVNMNIKYVGPAKERDIVFLKATLAGFGKTSILIDFTADAEDQADNPDLNRKRVAEGRLVFCTVKMIDEQTATISPVEHGLHTDSDRENSL